MAWRSKRRSKSMVSSRKVSISGESEVISGQLFNPGRGALLDPGYVARGDECSRRPLIFGQEADSIRIEPFLDFSMAIGESEPASVIMIDRRQIAPLARSAEFGAQKN